MARCKRCGKFIVGLAEGNPSGWMCEDCWWEEMREEIAGKPLRAAIAAIYERSLWEDDYWQSYRQHKMKKRRER